MRGIRLLGGALSLAVALGVAPAARAHGGHDGDRDRVQIRTIATGLDSPRHLAFGPRGDLYVAEAGRGGTGPCFMGGEGPACMGASGAVTKIDRWGRQYRIASGLASMANTPNNDNAIGPHGIIVTGNDRVLITNGGPTEPKDANGATIFREMLADQNPVASLFGKVLKINRQGRAIPRADIWDYERDFNPDKTVGNPAVDSNAVDLLQDGDRMVVADAGGNALDTVDVYGRVKNLALFPNRAGVPNPLGGPPISMQAVPTSVNKGPDGQYYVSQLTGFPFPTGGANIYRVDPTTGAVSTFATGFTNLMDLAFGRDGTLYALEIDHDSLLGPANDGALFTVSRSGEKRQITLPAGAKQSADSSYGYDYGSSKKAESTPAASALTVKAANGMLADAAGRTLYLWEADQGDQSACDGPCAQAWPPLTTDGKPAAGDGIKADLLGTSKRADGTLGVTYAGHPLYYFSGDQAAGDANGRGSDGFGAKWWPVAPDGAAIEH